MKTRGRPPIDPDDTTTPITVRVPSKQFDKMYAAAEKDRVSVAEWIRRRTREDDESKRFE